MDPGSFARLASISLSMALLTARARYFTHAATRRILAGATAFRTSIRHITPAQSLLLGFTFLAVAGAFLLTLPIASSNGARQPFIDALFTASSGVTTTGLIVVDTGSYYSLFGQVVILMLFQIGGLGYMTFIALFAYLLGSRLSLRAGVTLGESLSGARLGKLREFVRSVILFALAFEGLGAIVLSLYWMRTFPTPRALYLGVFHAISAFCTAGFSLFSDSFVAYRDSITSNLTVAVVTIAGGIGFFVLSDLSNGLGGLLRQRPKRMSIHTRLALAVSAAGMVAGTAIVFVSEASSELSFGQRMLTASFQALSASTTTGFNTVDIGAMSATSLFTLVVLMFIGSSPGGTGGGIKTTTLGVVLTSVIALLRGGHDTVVFRRRMPLDTVYRALTIGLMATVLITVATLILTASERAPFLSILFEVVSAFGTVGLSMGITPNLSPIGKVVISLMMLIGRLGPLAVGFALVARPKRVLFRYAEGEVFVG